MLKVHNGDISLPCFELARLAGADPVNMARDMAEYITGRQS
jgi:hypothetical protein